MGKFVNFLLTIALVGTIFMFAPEDSDIELEHGTNKKATAAHHITKTDLTDDTHFIPKIAHQEWKDENIPPHMKIWRDECIRLNPNWEFKLWTKDENLMLVQEHYPKLLDLYNGYSQGIKRIDMIRFLYLHKFGGVYMDIDLACVKPFNSFFDDYPDKFLLVNQLPGNFRDYNNALLAAPRKFEIFDDMFIELPFHKDTNIIEAAGGYFLQHHMLSKKIHKGKWVELPFDLFYAQDWISISKGLITICKSFDDCRTKFPHAITVHLGVGSWAGHDSSEREWEDSSDIPVTTNYTIPTEITNQIYISGTIDKDFCYECEWKAGTSCGKRLDYIVEHYQEARNKEFFDQMLEKNPQCRDTTAAAAITETSNTTVSNETTMD